MNPEHIVAGLTVLEPGGASTICSYLVLEEVDIILRESGILVDGDEDVQFIAGV